MNARCFDGNTALHIACARQLVAMVALLMTAGADQDCENEEIPDPGEGDTEGQSETGAAAETGGLDRLGLRPVDYANDNEKVRLIRLTVVSIHKLIHNNVHKLFCLFISLQSNRVIFRGVTVFIRPFLHRVQYLSR